METENQTQNIVLDNVNYSEIEMDPTFDLAKAPEDIRNVLDAEVDEFVQEKVRPEFIRRFEPCYCRRQEVMRKAAEGGSTKITITQDEINNFEYGVVVTANHGHPMDVEGYVTRCRRCGKITHYQNELASYMNNFMRFVNFHLSNDDTVNAPAQNFDNYVFEDMETGEQTPAGDIMRQLMGAGKAPVSMVDVETTVSEDK